MTLEEFQEIAREHIRSAINDIEYLSVVEAADEDDLSEDDTELIWELIQDALVDINWSKW